MVRIHDLFRNYHREFTTLLAITPKLLDEVYKIRFQVYCIENAFEDRNQHPDGRETDEYDESAAHILLLHRATGLAVGTARIILPHSRDAESLPIWALLRPETRHEFEAQCRRGAEVSRFAISKQFRRYWCERAGRAGPFGDCAQAEQELMRYITFGLFEYILDFAIEHRIDHLVAVMRPALRRILRNLDLRFEPMGEAVEHHGLRQPCIASVMDLLMRSTTHRTAWGQFYSSQHYPNTAVS